MRERSRAAFQALTLAVLAAGVLLRLLHLDADPESHIWTGYITDEGRWIAHARALALFGGIEPLDWHLHLYLAPMFQAASYVVFEALGVSILTSRLLPAAAGTALLLVMWYALREVATPEARLVTVALVALQPDLVMLSRVAIPEVPVMLLHLLAFLVLVRRPATRRDIAVAGGILLVAVATKATALPIIGIFASLALLDPGVRERVARHRRLLAAAGALVLAAALAALAVFFGPARPAVAIDTFETVGEFLRVSSVYEIVSFNFRDTWAPTFNVWLLLAWVGAAGPLVARGGQPDTAAHTWFAASAVWAALFTVMMVVLAYFPARYQAHVLIPLAVNIAAGLTILQRSGGLRDRTVFARLEGWRLWTTLAVLTLPSAVLAAPVLAGFAGAFATGLLGKLAAIAAALAALMPAVFRVARARGIAPIVIFPVAGVVMWAGLAELAGDPAFWFDHREPFAAAAALLRLVLLLAAAAVAAVLAAALSHGGSRGQTLLATAILGYAAVALVRTAPAYVDPRFTMRDASRHLGAMLSPHDGLIATSSVETLFTETALPYRSITGREWPPYRPQTVVVSYIFDDEGMLARYRLVQEYAIYVSPDFYETWPVNTSQPKREHVRVYRRAESSSQ